MKGQEDRDSRAGPGPGVLRGRRAHATARLDRGGADGAPARLALFEALSREDPADAESRRALAHCLRSLAIILTGVGRHDEALAEIGRSKDLFRALAEADPADRRLQSEWARAEMLYGMSLSSSHRPSAEVLEAVERARSILEAAVGPTLDPSDHPADLADLYGALALALEEAGRREEAMSAYNGHAIWERRCSVRIPRTPTSATSWPGPSATWGSAWPTPVDTAEALAAYRPGTGGPQGGGECQSDPRAIARGLGLDRYLGRQCPRRARAGRRGPRGARAGPGRPARS